VGAPSDHDAVERMNRSMLHRGPDDGGIYDSPSCRCVLGNRRLSIIDLSPAGRMPMSVEDGNLVITYNGELYNFCELRSELEARGHRFQSHTDTEVVLRMYMEYGERAVERLNGMFAFAIWNERERTLFLARDRMGIKPLYYAKSGDLFIFASEIRALLASGLVSREADRSAMAGYLSLGWVPDDRTIIAGVCSFPPAHHATVCDGKVTLHRYWSHTEEMRHAEPLHDAEIEDVLREGLKSAVQRQLMSDVPLGLFLSGGMDSSTLAALMRALGHETIRSVSIAFEESEYDESSRVRAVAERFGTEHVEQVVTARDVESELDHIVASMDQPTVDGINTYFVSRAAKEAGLTVALSGLGADELFGGYQSFQTVPRVRNVLRALVPVPGHKRVAQLAERSTVLPYRVRKLAAWTNGTATLEATYATIRGLIPPDRAATLAGERFDAESYMQATSVRSDMTEIETVSVMESRFYMHNQLLRDTDAMSMIHSLEVRVPFLDNDVISLAAQSRRLLGTGQKPALARARSIYFPRGEREDGKKGFTFPLDRWLRGPLANKVDSSLTAPCYLERSSVREVLSDFRTGHIHWSAAWAPTVLERWLAAHHVSAPEEVLCSSTS